MSSSTGIMKETFSLWQVSPITKKNIGHCVPSVHLMPYPSYEYQCLNVILFIRYPQFLIKISEFYFENFLEKKPQAKKLVPNLESSPWWLGAHPFCMVFAVFNHSLKALLLYHQGEWVGLSNFLCCKMIMNAWANLAGQKKHHPKISSKMMPHYLSFPQRLELQTVSSDEALFFKFFFVFA